MKKFKFKFQTVLEQRRMREKESLRALAAAQRAFQEAKNHRERLVQELDLALNRRELLGQKVSVITPFVIEQQFISGTKQRIIQADQMILRASRGVEKALRSYLFVKRELRIVETLYDKAYAQFRKERAVRETAELNDLMIMRAGYHKAQEEIA